MSPRVIVEHLAGSRRGTRHELDPAAGAVFGRHPRCEIAFDAQRDRAVSARHGELRREGDELVYVDLNSANGTWFQGKSIRRLPLQADDPVELELGRGGPRVRILYATASMIPETLVGVTHDAGPTTVSRLVDEALARRPARRRWALVAGAAVAALGLGWFLVTEVRRTRDAEARLLEARAEMARVAREQQIRAELEKSAVEPGVRIAAENGLAVYLIAATTESGEDQAVCTAFAVAPRYLATNSHCIDAMQAVDNRGGKVVAVRNGKPQRIAIKGWVKDERYRGEGRLSPDVGLVEVDGELADVVKIAPRERLRGLVAGQKIFLYGFPAVVADTGAPVASVLDGVIGRVTTFSGAADAEEALLVQHNAATSPGASGSPIFDVRGEVVALNVGQYRVAEAGLVPGLSISIRIDGLFPLLESRGWRPAGAAEGTR